jgi:hypothetical protein
MLSTATELQKRYLIRERAHEIWIERCRPDGCDVEKWLVAEPELAAVGGHSQRFETSHLF